MPLDRERIRRQHRHLLYRRLPRHPIAVLADGLDKEANAGTIIRTAEAFLTERVMFTRSEPDTSGAMGAEHWQPVEWGVDALAVVAQYRESGYRTVALEQDTDSISLSRYAFPERVLLVVGAELFGVSGEVLASVDDLIYIPQAGLVKSLNVGVAAAIALFEYSRQWWMRNTPPNPRHLAPPSDSLRLERLKPTCPED